MSSVTRKTAPKAAPSGKESIYIFIQTNTKDPQLGGNMLMFDVDVHQGLVFKNVDSYFRETITLYTVHFQI